MILSILYIKLMIAYFDNKNKQFQNNNKKVTHPIFFAEVYIRLAF
jgi:hypothetical protein